MSTPRPSGFATPLPTYSTSGMVSQTLDWKRNERCAYVVGMGMTNLSLNPLAPTEPIDSPVTIYGGSSTVGVFSIDTRDLLSTNSNGNSAANVQPSPQYSTPKISNVPMSVSGQAELDGIPNIMQFQKKRKAKRRNSDQVTIQTDRLVGGLPRSHFDALVRSRVMDEVRHILLDVRESTLDQSELDLIKVDPLEHMNPESVSPNITKPFEIPIAFLASHVRCGVCAEFVREPVMLGCCTKRFCRQCVEGFVLEGEISCPMCGGTAVANILVDHDMEAVVAEFSSILETQRKGFLKRNPRESSNIPSIVRPKKIRRKDIPQDGGVVADETPAGRIDFEESRHSQKRRFKESGTPNSGSIKPSAMRKGAIVSPHFNGWKSRTGHVTNIPTNSKEMVLVTIRPAIDSSLPKLPKDELRVAGNASVRTLFRHIVGVQPSLASLATKNIPLFLYALIPNALESSQMEPKWCQLHADRRLWEIQKVRGKDAVSPVEIAFSTSPIPPTV